MRQADLVVLANAAQQLESSNVATSISHIVGMPIEKAMSALLASYRGCEWCLCKLVIYKALSKDGKSPLYYPSFRKGIWKR